jgi:hypothetical protein
VTADEAHSFIELAREYGFFGGVVFALLALYYIVTKRWIVLPAMADLQAENARLRALLEAHNIEWREHPLP